MPRIAFVTSALEPAISPDDRLAADVLVSRGVGVEPAVWDDPSVDWSSYAAVVLRSPWDYHLKAVAFEAWLMQLSLAGVSLWNPVPVVLGNLHKRYLLDLAARGVPIVPTEYLPVGTDVSLRDVFDRRGWDDAIVKPAVSLGAHGTWRTSRGVGAADADRFKQQLNQEDLLVQPCLPEVEMEGEWSFVFLGGRYSHAVLKHPASGDFRVQVHFGGRVGAAQPALALIDQAAAVLKAVDSSLLYARVDGIVGDGRFVLMELEVTEPNLFLSYHDLAPMRFADAIEAAMHPPSSAT